MKTTRIFLGLVMLCGTAFGIPRPVITTTLTNGPTTVTIHARTTDGKVPVDVSCIVVSGRPTRLPQPEFLSILGKSGDWTATNVPPGLYVVFLESTNYIKESSSHEALDIEAGTNYTINFALSNGGWISGRVERPAELESNTYAWVNPEIQSGLPTNSAVADVDSGTDGTFRTGSLPAGTYTLHAQWEEPQWKGGSRQTWQAMGNVGNINVIVGRDTTNVFIPTKLIIQTNSTGGR